MWNQDLDAPHVARALGRAGVSLPPEEIVLQRRFDRWLAHLPERRLAWFPASPAGADSLAIEGRVLRLLRARCTFQVPEVVFVDPLGEFELRTTIGFPADIPALAERLRADPVADRRLGERIGAILAEQHTRIALGDVEGWLPRIVQWATPTLDVVPSQIEVVVPDRPDLAAAAREILARYRPLEVAAEDCALLHGDLGLHNLAMEDDGVTLAGVFDYGAAAWADRHHDFRVLVYDVKHPGLLHAAMEAYERATGYALSLERILLYNALVAFSHLAFRLGVPPGERWAGRTLDEDLAWCEWAAGNVLVRRERQGPR